MKIVLWNFTIFVRVKTVGFILLLWVQIVPNTELLILYKLDGMISAPLYLLAIIILWHFQNSHMFYNLLHKSWLT